MAVATSTAIIAAAVIGAGTAVYASEEQKKIAEEDQKKRDQAAATAKAEAERISRETKPEEEALAEVAFGTGDTEIGSTQEFLVPKSTTSALGTSATGRSGLGFKV